MRARMRAAVLAGPRRREHVAVERPRPGSGEVGVRPERCGARGPALATWQGRAWLCSPSPRGVLARLAEAR